MDLLRNKKNQKSLSFSDDQIITKEEANLERFKDPDDLTTKKMAIGLWILENRGHFMFLLTFFFASISIITWSIFVFYFGGYILLGMKDDKMISKNLLSSMVVGHDYYLKKAPQKLQYGDVQPLNNLVGVYDFITKVNNPNPDYWVEIDYSFSADGEIFGQSTGFVLPGEKKDFLLLGQNFSNAPSRVKMNILEERWHRIDKHIFPDWQKFAANHLNVHVKEVNFLPAKETVLTEKVDLNSLKFTVLNDSAYNYWDVGFIIVLYNGNRVVAVDKYILSEFMSDQTRSVDITWPGNFGKVTDISIVPELNITRDDIYIQFEGDDGAGNLDQE